MEYLIIGRFLFKLLFPLSLTHAGAPSDYGPENKVVCNVSYTDNLVLECPDPANQKAAFWKKVVNESYSVALCNAEGPECSLNDERNLTNQDSGLYFCRIPSDNRSNFHLAYVQISVLGTLMVILSVCSISRN